MQKWEYKTIRMVLENLKWQWEEDGKSLPAPVAVLTRSNELGKEGWEMIAVTSHANSQVLFYWFKRPAVN